MKTNKYQRRFYRDWVKAKDLHAEHIIDRETDLCILTNKPIDKDFVKKRVREYRFAIEDYISKDKRFLTALKPIEVEFNAPHIIKEMSQAAQKAHVGPMATVAGTIAQFLGRDLLKNGYKEVIIENGGDIFLATQKTRAIGIYAGKSKLWQGLSLKIKSKSMPLGICTSSGTIGHSLSFGLADSVVILSRSAILADAVATATCNLIKSKQDLQKGVDFAKSIKGILGIVIIIKNNFISWGEVEFVKLPH